MRGFFSLLDESKHMFYYNYIIHTHKLHIHLLIIVRIWYIMETGYQCENMCVCGGKR